MGHLVNFINLKNLSFQVLMSSGKEMIKSISLIKISDMCHSENSSNNSKDRDRTSNNSFSM